MSTNVTETIKQNLAEQLKTRHQLPFKLTLGSIAKHYNVSLTPIRQVVEQLIEQKLLTRKDNGRLERKIKPTGQNNNANLKVDKPINLNSDLDQLLTDYI